MRRSRLRTVIVAAAQRVGATRAGVLLIGHAVSPLQRWLYRRSGGRMSLTGRAPVLLLTTTGRRTGKDRTVPLLYVRDGDTLVICNVNPGSERTNPWTLNLRATPQARVQLGSEVFPVTAREVTGAELERLWPRLVRLWPAYESFHDRGGRRSVFVLQPTAGHLPSRPGGEFAIDLAVHVGRPASAVYAFLADIQDVEPIPRRAIVRMIKEPPGPTTVGTRWHESVRFAPGCWLHVESVVTDADEPHRLGMDFSSRPWSGHLSYDIDDDPEGCVLHHRELVRTHALLRPLTPAIERRLRARIEERLGDIRHVLMSHPGRAAPTEPAGRPTTSDQGEPAPAPPPTPVAGVLDHRG